jgi:hypothetical protein
MTQKRLGPNRVGSGEAPGSKEARQDFTSLDSPKGEAAPGRFASVFHFYAVLAAPEEAIKAVLDPATLDLLKAIVRGGRDCALCEKELSLNAQNTPGLLGYFQLDDGRLVALCCCDACVETLGSIKAAKQACHAFVDARCGGGTVEVYRGGSA